MKSASSTQTPIVVMATEEAFERLATRIAEKVIAAQSGGGTARGPIFTSKAPPPGMTRKWFNELCRQKVAKGDTSIHKVGRVWVAPAEAFERRTRGVARDSGSTEVWSAEAVLESVGVRPTR